MTYQNTARACAVSAAAVLALSIGAAPSQANPASSTTAGVQTADPAPQAKRVDVRPGAYQGRLRTSTGRQLEEFAFRVTKDRKIKRFRAALDVICSYGGSVEVETVGFVFPTTKINNNGTFKRRWKPNRNSDILLRGRLKNGQLTNGFLDYSVGVCVREAYLKARRTG